jgi:surface protein
MSFNISNVNERRIGIMDYSKRIWKPNDIISTGALNHIETGIEEANIEIEDAKVKKDGTSFPLLKDRLNDIDSQLGKLDNLDTQLNRLENIDSQLNKLENIDLSKFENVDEQFDRLDDVDSRLEDVENRIEELEQSDQFMIPDKSIEVEHLSEDVVELINQNSFVLEDKSIETKHLSEEIVNLLNKDCSISEEDYNSYVSFDVNELVFNSIKKPLYTITYNATENCAAHFTVVCDMSKITNYKTINLNMEVSNWSGPNRQQVSGGGTFSSDVSDLDGSYVHVCGYQGVPVINGDIVNGEGTLTGSIVPIIGTTALTRPYAKLAFVFTNLKVGQPISFDIYDISLTIDGTPLEILNFGGFFPKEGCTVVSHIEEPEEPEEPEVSEEHMIAKYTFNPATDSNLLPTFEGIANYTIKDETVENIFNSEWSPGVLGDIGQDMGASADYPNSVRSSYFKVDPNTLYYFNKEIHIFWFDSNKNFISKNMWADDNIYQVTSPEGAVYARVYRGSAADLIISKKPTNTIVRTIMSSDDFTSCKFQNKAALLSVEYLNVTNKATVLNHLFSICSNLTSVNASGWDTSNVTAMNDMFCQCSNLVSIEGLDTWDTGNVTNMQGMFSKCSKLQALDLSSFDTKNLNNVNYLFEACSALKNLNVSTWDVGKIVDYTWTFHTCTSLIELDLSGWNMRDTVTTVLTFQACQSLIKVICKQHTLLRFQGVLPTRKADSWGTIVCEDIEPSYDISILQGKYWNIEGLVTEPDEPDEPVQPEEPEALYHVVFEPTEENTGTVHFAVVMNRSDYVVGSNIRFDMNVSNWSGQDKTNMTDGGGVFGANTIELDGSFVGAGSVLSNLLLNGDVVNGKGSLSQLFYALNITATSNYVKLAYAITNVPSGTAVSFDINSISLKVDDKPVEILNLGGFFPKEGCTVVSYIDEPDEPEVPEEPDVPTTYHVEYTPTEKLNENDAAHFTVVMNRSDYVIGSNIHFSMNIDNWNGPERTAMEVGGGIFVANSSALDGGFNGGSAIRHLLLSGNLVDGSGVLERSFTAPNIVQDGSFVKLAFSLTKVEMGQTISFDVTDISLTVNNNPVEILNFGGFFPKEGSTVTEIK